MEEYPSCSCLFVYPQHEISHIKLCVLIHLIILDNGCIRIVLISKFDIFQRRLHMLSCADGYINWSDRWVYNGALTHDVKAGLPICVHILEDNCLLRAFHTVQSVLEIEACGHTIWSCSCRLDFSQRFIAFLWFNEHSILCCYVLDNDREKFWVILHILSNLWIVHKLVAFSGFYSHVDHTCLLIRYIPACVMITFILCLWLIKYKVLATVKTEWPISVDIWYHWVIIDFRLSYLYLSQHSFIVRSAGREVFRG